MTRSAHGTFTNNMAESQRRPLALNFFGFSDRGRVAPGLRADINLTLYEKLKFIFHRDIAPVASIMHVPNVIDVNPSVPVKTVPEFIAYAKANPGKLNMGSAGVGSSQHLAGELFKMMTNVNLVHVPYRGGAPAITDLLGGQVQEFCTM
jgi:tripartite-type tricarboxylate transporter receptor subunit TctC